MDKSVISKIIQAPAQIQVGKKGLTEVVINHIIKILKKEKITKLKFLNVSSKKAFQEQIGILLEKSNSVLLDQRGKTIVICRKKRS